MGHLFNKLFPAFFEAPSQRMKDRKEMKILTKLKTLVVSHKDELFGVLKLALIGLISTAVSNHYNEVLARNQLFVQARSEATKTFLEFVDVAGDRHYYAMRAVMGYKFNFTDSAKRYEDYDQAVQRWNKHRYSTLALLRRYFGEGAENEVYSLVKKFDSIHKQLTEVKKLSDQCKPLPSLDPLAQEIYSLDDFISAFSSKMQQQLKDGRVDIYQPNPPSSPK